MKDTAIIIVNWNGKKYLKDCLDSLGNQSYENFKVIFVDNGSEDGSVEFVRENYKNAQVITLKENTGFAHANNIGIQKAFEDSNTKYIITLNNDTKSDINYIKELVECAKRHPEAGSIQPKVINYFEKDRIDSTGILICFEMSAVNRGIGQKDDGQYESEEEIFGASASAALFTKEALEKTKLPNGDYFDSDYFAYYEDVDLAWRIRLAGLKSFYAPKAKIFHVHSATGKSFSPFKSFHIHRNHYYNMIKNLPMIFLIRALLFMPIRYVLLVSSVISGKGAASKLSKNKESMVGIVWKSWFDVVRQTPSLIQKRRSIQKMKSVKNSEIQEWLKKYKADVKKVIYG